MNYFEIFICIILMALLLLRAQCFHNPRSQKEKKKTKTKNTESNKVFVTEIRTMLQPKANFSKLILGRSEEFFLDNFL